MENNSERLINAYIEEGKKLILPEKHEKWTSYVRSTKGNLDSLHEVAIALNIIGMLNVGSEMDTIIEIFNQTECPVRTTSIRSLVANYSIRGPEFFEKTANGPIPEGNIEYLENLKRENTRLLFIHTMQNEGYNVKAIPNGPIVISTETMDLELLQEEANRLIRKKDE